MSSPMLVIVEDAWESLDAKFDAPVGFADAIRATNC
ncbi:hypothetical protein J2S51_002113 [Streptomyces sp. DSM 41269]|nr:hypothetical protein [Streptomyces sp. DSM 41269]